MPFFAAVAGLFFSFSFIMPAKLKLPAFFTCDMPTSMIPATAAFTSLPFSPVFSATDW